MIKNSKTIKKNHYIIRGYKYYLTNIDTLLTSHLNNITLNGGS